MSEEKKKVDESWKDQVSKEKKQAQDNKEPYHEPNFTVFASSLAIQAMIALGKVESPVSKKIERNLEQARFLIDTIGIIQEKTRGNLNPEEEKFLSESLFNLRTAYVQEKEGEK